MPSGGATEVEGREARSREAARVVAGCVLAGMRGGEDADALWAMGLADFEPWELNAAALRLLSGLLHSTANTWDLDAYEVAQRWALTLG